MSQKRRQKRQFKKSIDSKEKHLRESAEIVPLHERKVKKSMQNKGGYYKGMPGVSIDNQGNRKIINFIVTENGEKNAYLFAHPGIAKAAIRDAITDNKELREIVVSALVDFLFKSKRNPLYIFIRILFKAKVRRINRKFKRNTKRNAKQTPKN